MYLVSTTKQTQVLVFKLLHFPSTAIILHLVKLGELTIVTCAFNDHYHILILPPP